jgi:biopolymer transport protein ExbD
MKINLDTGATAEPRIELIPLIDIIFCILTFFLLAGLQVARQQAISVDIPKATTGVPQARELLMVSLNDAGQIFLEQQPILLPEQLVESVKQYRQRSPNAAIVLYASKQVSYNKVVEVLDLLRSVAGDRVALATLPADATAPNPPILPSPGAVYPTTPYNAYPGIAPYNSYPGIGQPNPGFSTAPLPGQVSPPSSITPNLDSQPLPTLTPLPTPSSSSKP